MALKLSYMHSPMKNPLIYVTIGNLVKKWAAETPDKTALVVRTPDSRDTITFGDLYSKSRTFAKSLIRSGVKPGDLVGMFVSNSPEWLIANVGVTMAGAAALNSYSYAQDDDFSWIRRAGCTSLVMDFRDNRIFDDLVAKVSKLTHEAQKDQMNFPIVYVPSDKLKCDTPEWTLFGEAIENVNDKVELPVVAPESSCYIFQSSGSTGKPKNIVHGHFGLLNNSNTFADCLQLTSDDVFWSPRPMGYGAGFPHVMFIRGLTFVTIDRKLIGSASDKALSHLSIDILREEGITSGYFSPYFVYDINEIKSKIGKLPKLKSAVTSGQRISAQSMVGLSQFARIAAQGYGLVETMWLTHHRVPDASEAESDVMGNPIPGVEIKIVDDDGVTVPIGESGEIYVRSPYMSSGYILHNGERMNPKTESGWLPTGDMGYIREDGRSYINGRKVEIIKKYAANIYPASIECEIIEHPDVKDVCVVGTPEPRMFEEIVAVVTRKSDSTLTKEELVAFARDRFKPDFIVRAASYMPGYIFIVDSLPKTISGKINRPAVMSLAKTLVEQEKHRAAGKEFARREE